MRDTIFISHAMVEENAFTRWLDKDGAVEAQLFIKLGSTMGTQPIHRTYPRRRVANLMRKAWELAVDAEGCGVHEQSGARRVFYAPLGLTGERKKFVVFEGHYGRKRLKMLNGRFQVWSPSRFAVDTSTSNK